MLINTPAICQTDDHKENALQAQRPFQSAKNKQEQHHEQLKKVDVEKLYGHLHRLPWIVRVPLKQIEIGDGKQKHGNQVSQAPYYFRVF